MSNRGNGRAGVSKKTAERSAASSPAVRVAGCDLGKSTAGFVVVSIEAGGRGGGDLVIESTDVVSHEGKPLDAFKDWYRRRNIARCALLGATGIHSRELAKPVLTGLPEDACLEAALEMKYGSRGESLNMVRIGASGYSVATRGNAGDFNWLENEKCSSGTGEMMVKIAARFGLSLEEADELALNADKSIPITARCSVFAKSEMTHFGNQGEKADGLLKGYFESVARNVAALLSRVRVNGPVLLIGGGSRVRALERTLCEMTGAEIVIPDDALLVEAFGAVSIAAKHSSPGRIAGLPEDPSELVRFKKRAICKLPMAVRSENLVELLENETVSAGEADAPSVLGLDLGSTGSKAVLTSIDSGKLLFDVYDKTRGNPVNSMQRLVEKLLETIPADIRAIGVTGSGREAAATVLRAAFPELSRRIVVINEIVAHATAAIRLDREDGRDLSIVEIGGQDAKFIQVKGGRIVESDMNKACSAGTGSFLEEQAAMYGLDDIEEFSCMAGTASSPPELGQMCTVFVADAAAEALDEGFGIPDIFAGFQYSVIFNYINRVMGQRSFGERIFFQGKPATSPSLAWTLAEVTEREVVVPPNPGAMGAWGIGLHTLSELESMNLKGCGKFNIETVLRASVDKRSDFRCRDKECATWCIIEKTTVNIDGKQKTITSGGACPKFESGKMKESKLPVDAPSPVDERDSLIAPFLRDHPGKITAGLPYAGALMAIMPWAHTLLKEAGLGIRVMQPGSDTLSRGEKRCHSYDACAPVKVAHGVVDSGVDAIFFPKLLEVPIGKGTTGKTCPMEQALPEMVAGALSAEGRDVKVFKPVLRIGEELGGMEQLFKLREFGTLFGVRTGRLFKALSKAADAQKKYEEALTETGSRALAYGKEMGIPVVAVCGSLHVIHDRIVNARIPSVLREKGVIPLPMDCFPVPSDGPPLPGIAWAESRRTFSVAVAARARGDVFPLLLSSFGCGPASFAEQLFGMLMEGYPHTALESDAHGGTAGYVTRIEAFLHTVRRYEGNPSPVPEDRLALMEPPAERSLLEEKDSRLVPFAMSDRMAPLVASFYRSFGFDAVPSGPNSARGLTAGRKDCSGKECLPYQLIWGAFRNHVDNGSNGKQTVLLQIQGSGMCRNCMFILKDQLNIKRMGKDGHVRLRPVKAEPGFELHFVTRFWSAVIGWGLLQQLVAYYRPLVAADGELESIYEEFCNELEEQLSSPADRGLSGLASNKWWRPIVDLLDRASDRFVSKVNSAGNGNETRTVLLTGDIYLRLDEFGSDFLVQKLNERGISVLVDPACVLAEYFALERTSELVGLPTGLIKNTAMRFVMSSIRRRLYDRVMQRHSWLTMPDAQSLRRLALSRIDRHPIGEAPITIGSVLHAWQEGACDGVVAVSPWGCGPALITESLLRHENEIPILFIYNDGSPIDERRLDSFAFRLKNSPVGRGDSILL